MSTATTTPLPLVIQGGMGIGISDWRLARAVSGRGHLGVVSGTCIDSLFVRRLQDGDVGGHLRQAMAAFPWPEVSARALTEFFIPAGKREGSPYRLLSLWKEKVNRAREQITVLAAFAEVHLARQGHDGPVGINLLTKIEHPTLSTLYGAMLAGVDYVLMGAGIPREIPGALDALAEHRPARLRLHVEGDDPDRREMLAFDPSSHWPEDPPAPLRRPRFLPIVSSDALARMLVRKANGKVDGFVVEAPTAGGHNAPPRGRLRTNERDEPIYGDRDEVDVEAMRELGLPFWMAGGTGSPEGLSRALAAGAAGVQVGTLFAYAQESGLAPELKRAVLDQVRRGRVELHTDLRTSPTGFPFKVVQVEGTASDPAVYESRERICDMGYLRTAYRRPDGRIGYRCPAEPVGTFVKKGGSEEDTVGRRCLCNALMADVDHAQVRANGADPTREPALVTSGDDLLVMNRFVDGRESYSADQVLDWLTAGLGEDRRARRVP
jgi:nitronate monooxygenase